MRQLKREEEEDKHKCCSYEINQSQEEGRTEKYSDERRI